MSQLSTNIAATAFGYATIGIDRYLRLWDHTGERLAEQKVGTGAVKLTALAAPSSGEFVVTGTKKLVRWDARTGARLDDRAGHGKGEITDVVFLEDERTFVSSARVAIKTQDNSVIFWSVDSVAPLRKVVLRSAAGGACEVERLVRAPGSDDLFAIGYDRGGGFRAYVFHIAPGAADATRLIELNDQPNAHAIAAAPNAVFVDDGNELRAYAWDGTLRATISDSGCAPLAVSRDGTQLAVVAGETVQTYATADLAPLKTYPAPYTARQRMTYTPSGTELLIATASRMERFTL